MNQLILPNKEHCGHSKGKYCDAIPKRYNESTSEFRIEDESGSLIKSIQTPAEKRDAFKYVGNDTFRWTITD